MSLFNIHTYLQVTEKSLIRFSIHQKMCGLVRNVLNDLHGKIHRYRTSFPLDIYVLQKHRYLSLIYCTHESQHEVSDKSIILS